MFRKHDVHKVPHGQQRIWRYLAADRLRDLLDTSEIYFTNLSVFSDGLEGLLTRRTRDYLYRWYRQQGDSHEKALEEVRLYERLHSTYFASCWHMNDHESYLMWRSYADRGFAVSSTWERAAAAFDDVERDIYGGIVRYIDFDREQTDVGNTFDHIVTKDRPYRDEREVRLLCWKPELLNSPLAPQESGVRVPIKLKMLVESVWTNPFYPEMPSDIAVKLSQLNMPVMDSTIKHR